MQPAATGLSWPRRVQPAKRGQETGDVAMMEAGRRGIQAAPGRAWQFKAFLDQLEADLEARKTDAGR
jgi:hypothetical protein